MASVLCYEDLTCSVCLSLFTDPVTLPCGHSFCRQCVAVINSCPQCRADISTEAKCLPTSFILKSLAEKTREAEKMKEESRSEKAEVPDLCPEHEEKLKLFCITEQQLACIICRDGERHEGHKFKPIKEAAASLRKELEMFVQHVSEDIHAIESLANTQNEEIRKTKEKSEQLKTQIRSQFEEMHQFLRRREDEIKNELKHKEEDGQKKMSHSLNAIEAALSERKEMEVKATLVLKISGSEKFLKSYTEDKSMMTTEDLFRPRANELQVVNTSLSLGPYESHLQFFMWKEMLQVIQPRAERLSLKSNSTVLSVSDDGRSLFSAPRSNQAASFSKSGPLGFGVQTGFNTTQSTSGFGSSQAMSFGMGSSAAPTFGQQSENISSSSSTSLFGLSTKAPSSGGFGSVTAPTFGQQSKNISSSSSTSLFGLSTKAQSSGGFGFVTAPTFGQQSENIPSSSSTSLFGSSTKAQSSGLFGSVTAPSFAGQSVNISSSSSSSTGYACSVTEFTSGQHYWEVEVGSRDYWELGLKDNSLKYDGQIYRTLNQNVGIPLVFEGRPRKIGVYLNCSSKKLSFYDADNMKLIHTVSPDRTSMPVSAYFNIRHKEPDHNPITVCWY